MKTPKPSDSCPRDLLKLRERQTELSAMIANQQRTSLLPVQEPPMFSGDYFDYPIFIRAFETMIESKVDIIKGFVTVNSVDGYKEARKLLAKRFGYPFHKAQGYNTRLKRWPQVGERDGLGMQEFSDYLICCRDSMKTMKSFEELNSTETLRHVSSKLPSYSGVSWCRRTFELRRQTEGSVTFSNSVEFIKSEADLAMDPAFSPHTIVKERTKGSRRSTSHKEHPSRGTTRANALSPSSSVKARPSHATQGGRCLSCSGYHTLDDCPEFKKLSLEDRLHFVRTSNLCFGCFRKGHM